MELAKEPDVDDDLIVPNGHYGLLIMDYDVNRRIRTEGVPRLRIRAAFDLTGLDFSQNFVVLGNVPVLQPKQDKLKYLLTRLENDNWLKPLEKGFVIVILTFHDTIPLFHDDNWEDIEFTRKQWTGLAGQLKTYVKESRHDLVAIADKEAAKSQDRLRMINEIMELYPFEDTSWILQSTEEENEAKSLNKCLFYEKRFSGNSFTKNRPTPNQKNECDEQIQINEEETNQNQCTQIEPGKLEAMKEALERMEADWEFKNEVDWEFLAYLAKRYQNDLINWEVLLVPEIQEWLMVILDPENYKNSRYK